VNENVFFENIKCVREWRKW